MKTFVQSVVVGFVFCVSVVVVVPVMLLKHIVEKIGGK